MTTTATHIDPVCGMAVNTAQAHLTAELSEETYYFCAARCRKQFLADPAKYLEADTPKRKGFFRRYLDRVKKSTDGKPPSCCG